VRAANYHLSHRIGLILTYFIIGGKHGTPLNTAICANREDVACLLIQCGANTTLEDMDGLQPIHLASKYPSKAILRLLYKVRDDLNIPDDKRWQPLRHAVESGSKAVVGFLLKYGAIPSASYDDGWRPLFAAARNGRKDIVKLLLKPQHRIHGNTCRRRCARPF
jgi:ankyrin repeat protein